MQAALQLFEPDPDAFFRVLNPLVSDAVLEDIAEMDSVRLPDEGVRRLYEIRDGQLDCDSVAGGIRENLTFASWIEKDRDRALRYFPESWERSPHAMPTLSRRGHITRAWASGLLIRCMRLTDGEVCQDLTVSAMKLGEEALWCAARLIAYDIRRRLPTEAPHPWLALAAIAIQFPLRFQTAELKLVLRQYVANVESVNSQQVQPFVAIGPLAAIVRERIADLHRETKPRR